MHLSLEYVLAYEGHFPYSMDRPMESVVILSFTILFSFSPASTNAIHHRCAAHISEPRLDCTNHYSVANNRVRPQLHQPKRLPYSAEECHWHNPLFQN
jgi:hypothetical protein